MSARPRVRHRARIAALGIATVDAERWCAEHDLPAPAPGPDEPALGARSAHIGRGAIPTVLLEPSTEGLLAAALARHGEGPVCVYLEGLVGSPMAVTLLSKATALGRPGRLVRPESVSGPFVILLD